MKSKEQAVVNLVINGEQGKSSLRELTGAYNALNAEIVRMKRADDPKGYDERIKKLALLKQARDAERNAIYGAGEASKKFSEDFKKAVGESSEKLGPFGGLLSKVTEQFGAVKDSVASGMSMLKQYNAAVDTAKAAQLAATEANEAARIAELALAAGTGTAAAAEEARAAALVAGTTATEASTVALKIFKVAMASTGIGLVVVALGALVTWLTQTNEGMRVVKGAWGGLNALFQAGIKLIAGFGKGIIDAVSHPVGSIQKIGKIFEEQVMNRFRAFAVIYQGILKGDFKAALNGVLQLGSGVTSLTDKIAGAAKGIANVAKAGVKLAEDQRALLIASRAWELEKIGLIKQADVLTQKIRQQTLSPQERIRMAEQAKVIRDKVFKTDMEHAKEKQRLILVEQGMNSKKDKQAIADSANMVATIDAEHATSMQNIENRESRLQQKLTGQQASAKKKASDAAKKENEDLQKLLAELDQSEQQSFMKNMSRNDAELYAITMKYAREREEAHNTYKDKENLRQALAAIDNAEASIKEETIKKQESDEAERKKKQREEDFKLSLEEINRRHQEEQNANSSTLADGLEGAYSEEVALKLKQQYQEQERNLTEQHLLVMKGLYTAYGKDTGDIDKQLTAVRIADAEKELEHKKLSVEAKKKLEDTVVNLTMGATGAIKQLFGQRTAIYKAALAVEAAYNIAKVTMDTVAEVKGYYKTYSGIPGGVLIASVLSGLAVVRSGIGIASITKAAAMNLGGGRAKAKKGALYTPDGPSHEEGGMDLYNNVTGEKVLEMEGRENILILRKDLPSASLAMIKRLAFDSTFNNPAQVDTSAINSGIRMARSGAFVNDSTGSAANFAGTRQAAAGMDNSRLEGLMLQLIESVKEEKTRPAEVNLFKLEIEQKKIMNIRDSANA